MTDGGREGAAAVHSIMDWCPVTHEAINAYLAAQPWVKPPEGTTADMFMEFDHDAVSSIEAGMVNLWAGNFELPPRG